MNAQTDSPPFWRMTGITKHYGGVTALSDVDFSCGRGKIHAILGENGAGKSTLIKIMAGVVEPSEGQMFLEGQEVRFSEPAEAPRKGIVSVFQELSLMPDLSVADNISISDPPGKWGFINARAQRRRAEELLARIGCEDVHPDELVKNLSLSRRQMVEIAKALGRNPSLLILDEATSALTASDVQKIYDLLGVLRNDDLAILYISHRMHEIEELADECSVFRNGRHVDTFTKGTRTDNEIIELMIGREYSHVFPDKPKRETPPAPALGIRNLSWDHTLEDISFDIGKGEIVGIGGLDGQGQRELLLALFGVLRGVSGKIEIDGKPASIPSPHAAKSRANRIALIPEDRKTEGLMLPMSVADNVTLASLGSMTRGFVIDRGEEARRLDEMVRDIQIKVGKLSDPVSSLSGGNQQKVVIAKWLMTKARILLLNDPTRGIDVGTKQELYQLLRRLADDGTAILFYSTDYDELIGCCDRVEILYDGRVVRTLAGDEINERNIISGSLNIGADAAVSDSVTPKPA